MRASDCQSVRVNKSNAAKMSDDWYESVTGEFEDPGIEMDLFLEIIEGKFINSKNILSH